MRFEPNKTLLRLATALPLIAGCGVSEGEMLVFRIALEEQIISDGCFDEDNPRPEEDALSSSSYLTPLTWVVYVGANDKLILDAAGVSIGGEETSDGFTFIGHTIDVDYEGTDNAEAKVTIITETTVTMDTDGTAVKGDFLDVVTASCDFLTATPSSGLCIDISNCERRAKFVGVQIDADLNTTINAPNPL